jgi:hypothetical protein
VVISSDQSPDISIENAASSSSGTGSTCGSGRLLVRPARSLPSRAV